MIEYHLCFWSLFTRGFPSEIDQPSGIEQRLGVPLQSAGIPREVDQQTVEDVLGVGAGRLGDEVRRADRAEMILLRLGQIAGVVRTVLVEESAFIADDLAPVIRLPDKSLDLGALGRDRNGERRSGIHRRWQAIP